ncbi:MAG TPA: 30S ribosomal protein S6 [Candidatus Faecenecus gallistercoris]|jgi:small subunit ribosomal protein S6|uniref:Small ribosomal subunit protein bS6 n=1 Tax=Candidatus Faecenecus gallistercoris TaxID=2840793 RepID=A0A9D0YYT2_9FIRM|nr:30S ribosomal protein S6 [Bacillota bacterium]MDY4051625.1 30S ribosomal protein S6 [Candidatus Faecenecus gallistercoris]CDE08881.1 30S ribosomal protein S6 [Bacillus sp. CAG:988]MDD7102424.1 30S ribosomal protein S6 [Bacillota bacterium]PWL72647.1 MAG: 30S ribosomal protein S6 [Bacillota bacterium]
MKKYEIMFIVKTDLDEAANKAVAENMKKVLMDQGATIVEEQDMGQKELAYEMNHHKTGHYYLFVIESKDSKAVKEFDRLAVISENILRHLIVKKEA